MKGAEALIRTLVANDVNVCFANPGTSEMHFVAALDSVPEMRAVLCLFEGVATGAADGYARMVDRPAATLTHLGVGFANGIANLHNARRAGVPVINVVGDHATYHKGVGSPLDSAIIEDAAPAVSGWVGRPSAASEVGQVTSAAIAAAISRPRLISTLILPADVSWDEGGVPGLRQDALRALPADAASIDRIAKVLRTGGRRTAILAGGRATSRLEMLALARISQATGSLVLLETTPSRVEQGSGIPRFGRLAYRAEAARAQLQGVDDVIFVDMAPPVSYFAYPGLDSAVLPDRIRAHALVEPGQDVGGALVELAEQLAPSTTINLPAGLGRVDDLPSGLLTAPAIAEVLRRLIPEGAVIVDESVSSSLAMEEASAGAAPHWWLRNTGGSIGLGLPLAVGCAIAVPDSKIISIEADGSAMYTLQALWTMAREQLDVTIIVLNNRSYGSLSAELDRVGAAMPEKGREILSLTHPDLGFVQLAHGLGVNAERAETVEQFSDALGRALAEKGPRLVDAAI